MKVNWHLLDPPPWDGVFPWDSNHPETSPGEVVQTIQGELCLVTALTSGVLIATGSGQVEPYLKVRPLSCSHEEWRLSFSWSIWKTLPKLEEWE